MRNTQVLFISQHSEDRLAWAYGLGKQGIFSASTTIEDICADSSLLQGCTLLVVDIDESQEQVISFCGHLCTMFRGPVLVFTYDRDERFHLKLYQTGIDETVIKPIGHLLALAKILSWLRVECLGDDLDPIGRLLFGR